MRKMAKKVKKDNIDKKPNGISRRDFFKISAAAGAAGSFASTLDWAVVGPTANIANAATTTSTCPYCSVGCGLSVDAAGGVVTDIYGDTVSPINLGALCSKGAASIQLVNNTRRVGVSGSIWTASAPPNEGPMKRTGNGSWSAITWDTAMTEIASAMTSARSAVPVDASGGVTGNAQGVAFLGCAHATNEENWIYRKMIANFGTNHIEHQARI